MNEKRRVYSSRVRTARLVGSFAFRILTAAICLLLFYSPLWAAPSVFPHETDLAQQDTTVRIEPAQPTVMVSETFTASLMIDNVGDLWAFELELLDIPNIITMYDLPMRDFAPGKGESPLDLRDLRLVDTFENSQVASDENGSDWDIETVDSEGWVGYYTSMSLDGDGYPHISYRDSWPNNDLKYAYQDASGWHIETVDSEGNVGVLTSVTLDEGGYPHISYFANNELKYAYRDASGWHIEAVESEGRVGYYTSLSLDGGGYPHISYYDFYPNYDLKYAYQDAHGWHIVTVDSEGDVGKFTSLALDANGYPHISYYDDTNSDLKYVYQDASSWHIETVDSEGRVGYFSSLAIDGRGYSHISYLDLSNRDPKELFRNNFHLFPGKVRLKLRSYF